MTYTTQPKNIGLFSDGTGRSSSKLFKTNVWRLYQALDLSIGDAEGVNKILQIAYIPDQAYTQAEGWLSCL